MGDHQHRCARFARGLQKQSEDDFRIILVKVPGRFVRENQLWPRRKCASDGNALLLATRKRLGILIKLISKPDPSD